jgi:glycosyltransferase involved in cell wall biosynthesis
MRVLHVIDTSAVGGGQTSLRHMLDGCRGTDVQTELACRDGGPLMDSARELGTVVHAIPFDKRFLPHRAFTLARIVRDRQIDLMHSHGLLATYYCTLARGLFGAKVPLVYHQHGFHHHNHGAATQRARIRAEKWLATNADRVVAVSRADYDRLLAEEYVPESRLRLVYYGLPGAPADPLEIHAAREAMAVPVGSPVVGLVGRLAPQKGVDVFLRAAAIAKQRRPGLTFVVVGVGPLEGELRALASSIGMNGDLRWMNNGMKGVVASPNFTVGVLSSRWEGLPLVLLEYMASGRPIVTTRIEGCLDAVSPAEAEIVEPENPEAMADAIVRLVSDPELARQRAAAAQARFESSFSLEVMVGHLRALYREVCA